MSGRQLHRMNTITLAVHASGFITNDSFLNENVVLCVSVVANHILHTYVCVLSVCKHVKKLWQYCSLVLEVISIIVEDGLVLHSGVQ